MSEGFCTFAFLLGYKIYISNMNILLLGSGGREHAIAYKLAQSAQCSQLFIAPGNAGTEVFVFGRIAGKEAAEYATGI